MYFQKIIVKEYILFLEHLFQKFINKFDFEFYFHNFLNTNNYLLKLLF